MLFAVVKVMHRRRPIQGPFGSFEIFEIDISASKVTVHNDRGIRGAAEAGHHGWSCS